MTSLEDRVNNGIKELDAKVPWWREKINSAILDMSSHSNCVLGQIYDSYYVGTLALKLDDEGVIYYGFEVTNDELYSLEGYKALTEVWKRQLLGAA